jgi:hypothetical protein
LKSFQQYYSENPRSPLFARVAHGLLQQNDPAGALKIALEGLKHFPDYATGILIAAEAYVMLRRFSDARQLLLQLLRTVPACKAAELLLDRIVELELEYPSPLDSATPPSLPLGDDIDWVPRNKRRNWSKADELIPGLGSPGLSLPAFSSRGAEKPAPSPPSSDLETLAVRLEHAKIPLQTDDLPSPIPEGLENNDETDKHPPIHPATETMAMIFAQQGNIEAAILVYRELCEIQPFYEDEYRMKIAGLEELRNME